METQRKSSILSKTMLVSLGLIMILTIASLIAGITCGSSCGLVCGIICGAWVVEKIWNRKNDTMFNELKEIVKEKFQTGNIGGKTPPKNITIKALQKYIQKKQLEQNIQNKAPLQNTVSKY
ncbi:Plasmodium exported protein, unknown function [Plasmodium reichenowi]|uniref:Uncharacterized protein n=1 Tax=Plasmodium reichenowi TaxID=5854 RepID=A0A2P9DT00_PLARE|nr:Plasmodium exported protein, unknown function [Plasmodium reichenowi]